MRPATSMNVQIRFPPVRIAAIALALAAAALVSSCQPTVYRGELVSFGANRTPVTRIEIDKSARSMELFHGERRLRSYRVSLGFEPEGHKVREGDGRTPEGTYFVNRRNPESQFYLSLGISYPNERDVRKAAELGVDPGGDIFIHGQPTSASRRKTGDWTAGCIAVSNREMRAIYEMVDVGTPVHIFP